MSSIRPRAHPGGGYTIPISVLLDREPKPERRIEFPVWVGEDGRIGVRTAWTVTKTSK
jgi:hypothetical protein